MNSITNEPIEYVSIGVINTFFCAITNETGYFEFEIKNQSLQSSIRVSMIGYEPQLFSVADLINKETKILMVEKPYKINDVVIKPSSETKIGANGFNRFKGWSGWGGTVLPKGYEIGIKLSLGSKLTKIKTLHVLLHRQSFDKSLFRLHIRSIRDTLISEELLTENILLEITKESGWAEINLEKYNLIFSGDIVLTLEWLKVQKKNEDRAMKINGRIQDAYILLKNKKNETGIFRWGTEAKWKINKESSPSIYVTVLK